MHTSSTKLPEKANICAVIVSYHPDVEFPDRLRTLARQVDCVVIVDNGSSEQEIEMLGRAASGTGATVVRNQDNIGIASALNQGLEWAREHGFEWLLTLDQDTVLMDGVVETFAEVYKSCATQRNVAMIGSNYIDRVSGHSFIEETGKDGLPWVDALTVITSGTLLSVAAAGQIGRFRDEFFIDHVDDEYCLRARRFGYVSVMTRRPLMVHTSGSPRYHEFLGKRLTTPHLSAARRYYRTRNLVALIREYRCSNPEWVNFAITVRYKETILMLMFEKNKIQKMLRVLQGIFDGIRRKTGPLK